MATAAGPIMAAGKSAMPSSAAARPTTTTVAAERSATASAAVRKSFCGSRAGRRLPPTGWDDGGAVASQPRCVALLLGQHPALPAGAELVDRPAGVAALRRAVGGSAAIPAAHAQQ